MVTGPQGTSTQVIGPQLIVSQVTGSSSIGSQHTGSQTIICTSSGTRSSKEEDTTLVWEVSTGKRKPKWLQETLNPF